MLSSTYNNDITSGSINDNDDDNNRGDDVVVGSNSNNNAPETHNVVIEETTFSFTNPLQEQEQEEEYRQQQRQNRRYLSRATRNNNNNNNNNTTTTITDTPSSNISQSYEADDENSTTTTPPTTPLPPPLPTTPHRATYTDRNGLLLYLDPNVPTPTIRFRLSEERHSQNRCMSNLYFVVIYLLMRLWLEAFLTKSVSFVVVCGVGTLWMGYGLYRRRRDWEEELERRMEELMMLVGGGGRGGGGGVLFGGEGSEGDGGVMGVSEEMRRKWVRFVYGEENEDDDDREEEEEEEEGQRLLRPVKVYGSVNRGLEAEVATSSSLMVRGGGGGGGSGDVVEGETTGRATCSICLCDYEDGERVVILPCLHMYHDDCITPWTLNHTKCPLCNFDLQLNER